MNRSQLTPAQYEALRLLATGQYSGEDGFIETTSTRTGNTLIDRGLIEQTADGEWQLTTAGSELISERMNRDEWRHWGGRPPSVPADAPKPRGVRG